MSMYGGRGGGGGGGRGRGGYRYASVWMERTGSRVTNRRVLFSAGVVVAVTEVPEQTLEVAVVDTAADTVAVVAADGRHHTAPLSVTFRSVSTCSLAFRIIFRLRVSGTTSARRFCNIVRLFYIA